MPVEVPLFNRYPTGLVLELVVAAPAVQARETLVIGVGVGAVAGVGVGVGVEVGVGVGLGLEVGVGVGVGVVVGVGTGVGVVVGAGEPAARKAASCIIHGPALARGALAL